MKGRITSAFAFAFALGVVAACAHDEAESPAALTDGGGDADSGAALPPGVDHYEGNVACCAEDTSDCCPEPRDGYCESYIACVQAGKNWEPKGPECQQCCAGLTHLRVAFPNDDGTCDRDAGLQLEPDFVCAACGNGICEQTSGENHCSCPADCP